MNLDKYKSINGSTQGFIYERLWDLCIKFGVTNLTLPSVDKKLQTSHIFNNANIDDVEFQKIVGMETNYKIY